MQSLRVGVTAGRISPKIRPNRFLGFSRGFHFLVNQGGMDQQTYLDLITALNIIQDVRSSPEQRQSAENAVSAFGEVPNAISYIYYILGTNSERIFLFLSVVTK